MSKITRPIEEPSVTCGFFNSTGDRKYDATQFSSLFDGLINDGIFGSIGDKLIVHAGTGNTVIVGTGKAWLNHTWTLNDAPLPIVCPDAEQLNNYNRYDAIVLEVNLSVRDNIIKCVKGTPTSGSTVAKPTMVNNENIHQYPLCYIYRPGNTSVISESNIENAVGTKVMPFVTGILEVVSVDELLGQWRAQLDEFVASEKQDINDWLEDEDRKVDAFIEEQETDFNTWYSEMKQLMDDVTNELDAWSDAEKASITAWFDEIKDQLSTDAAVNLQMQIDAAEVKQILKNGFVDGVMTMSESGDTIIYVDTNGRKLTVTNTDDASVITYTLEDQYGVVLGRLIKNISDDGSVITSSVTIRNPAEISESQAEDMGIIIDFGD